MAIVNQGEELQQWFTATQIALNSQDVALALL